MLPLELTKDTPYLALSGELWSAFYEYYNRNLSCYKGFLLYLIALPSLTPEGIVTTEIYRVIKGFYCTWLHYLPWLRRA